MTWLSRLRGPALTVAILALSLITAGHRAEAAPLQVSIGVYLASVHNLDFLNGKFTADFWMWSNSASEQLSPLESVALVNEVKKDLEPLQTVRSGGGRWDQRRVRADLWADWQASRFPFDSQTLTIVLEESSASTADLVYVVDQAHSGIDHNFRIPGWTVTGWTIAADPHEYATNFGDPAGPHTVASARVVFTLNVQREGIRLYLDLCLGAFVAFGIMALSFRLLPIVPPIYGARMVIIVGSMFTVVVSMRAIGAAYAAELGETLPYRIHLVTLAAGFLAALGGVIARRCVEAGDEATGLKCDRWALPLFVGAYAVIVCIMTMRAYIDF